MQRDDMVLNCFMAYEDPSPQLELAAWTTQCTQVVQRQKLRPTNAFRSQHTRAQVAVWTHSLGRAHLGEPFVQPARVGLDEFENRRHLPQRPQRCHEGVVAHADDGSIEHRRPLLAPLAALGFLLNRLVAPFALVGFASARHQLHKGFDGGPPLRPA